MKTKNKAFTLIELLVVIVIIGILSAIGISSFQRYKNKANNINTSMVVNQYMKGLKLYFIEYGKFPIPTGTPSSDGWFCLGCPPGATSLRTAGSVVPPDASLDSELQKLMGDLPYILDVVNFGVLGDHQGMAYRCDDNYVDCQYISLDFYLFGMEDDCYIEDVTSITKNILNAGNTHCEIHNVTF